MTILGLHHITLVSSDAQRTTDFYTGVLGMRFIKQTVNFDDPTSYHLYFGDENGSPGSAITYFEWKGAPRGRRGIGGTHHYGLGVPGYDAVLKWKRRLIDHGLDVTGPFERHDTISIYFADPDGMIIEIATDSPGTHLDVPPEEVVIHNRDAQGMAAETWPEPVDVITADMALMHGMHHITAITQNIKRIDAFYNGLLGMPRVQMASGSGDASSTHWHWAAGDSEPGGVITYFEREANKTPSSRMGAGHTHHFALAVADEDAQLQWREKLIKAGLPVSPVMDRDYFKSIYTRDPNGHIVELATLGPGFTVDEPLASLGQSLRIPAMHEPIRAHIEANLKALQVPMWNKPQEAK
jgi:glyoxalase family protein